MVSVLTKIKAFFASVLAFFSALFGFGGKTPEQPAANESETPAAIVFQAHRGLSATYPENTLAAFRAAGENGFGCIELDPAVTKDGQVVVMHDRTANRTCRRADGSALPEPAVISEMTYEALSALDAGLYFGEAFRGEKVPLLTDALALAREYGMKVKIDNKIQNFTEEELEKVFLAAAPFGDTAEFTVNDLTFARRVHERFPSFPLHYDGPVSAQILRDLSGLYPKEKLTVWLPMDTPGTAWNSLPKADPENCALVRSCARLGLWILTLPEELEAARALGADVIETPGELLPPA